MPPLGARLALAAHELRAVRAFGFVLVVRPATQSRVDPSIVNWSANFCGATGVTRAHS
jgi:hypothetical protein